MSLFPLILKLLVPTIHLKHRLHVSEIELRKTYNTLRSDGTFPFVFRLDHFTLAFSRGIACVHYTLLAVPFSNIKI